MRHKIFTGLGFEKCHSLSMQPIFKLFLKAVADSKIPDHESLIGCFFFFFFFAEHFTVSKPGFHIYQLMTEGEGELKIAV